MAEFQPRRVSVIVLTWNGLEVTRNCLRTLLEVTTHPDFEVVVVDNGSTDGTQEYVGSLEGVRLVENTENLGFVRGNNAGIRATDRDVVLLNNDTEIIQPDWLERMQELAYSRDDIGLVGCRLTNDKGMLVHAGTYMPVPSFWGQEYPGGEKDVGQYSSDREVEGVIAACVYIKREVIDRIGALDEDYYSYFEDTDYCLKAQVAGYRVYRCGSATVRHLEHASTDVNRLDFSGTFRSSRQMFMSKWKDYYDSRYTRRLTWHTFLSRRDVYSRASGRLGWELDRVGVDLNLGFLEGEDNAEIDDFRLSDMKNRGYDRGRPQVLFGPPDKLSLADGSYNIGYVFTPYDRFSAEWVREMNRMDEIWVTTDFQRGLALDSGVERPVHVMPLGVDVDYMNPGIHAYPLPERYTFLAPVKWDVSFAVETLLRAFIDEFSADEKAVLVCMVTTTGLGAEVEQEIEALNLPFERAPVVFVVDHDVPDYQMGSLYRSADCLVLVGRESVTPMSVAEAAACGVPVVATGWGLPVELAASGSVFGIECGTAPAPLEGCGWADPDYGSIRRLLRGVYSEPEAAREKALAFSRSVAESLCWDVIAGKIVERLDAVPGS